MMHLLWQARSRKWLTAIPIATLIITLLVCSVRFLLTGTTFDLILALRMLLFSFILAVIYGGFGYFGLRYLLLTSMLGLLLGLVMMSIMSQGNSTGWEDLAGFIAFLFLLAAGFVLGIVIELIRLVVIYLKRKQLR